jgi:alkylation response protein AidB-like acyl-CoA dehydrogenase
VSKEDVSFMRKLCMGEIEEDLILPFPEIGAGEREMLEQVTSSLGTLFESHAKDFRHWDRKGEFPPEYLEELRQFGLFSFVIPEEFGGMGFGSAAYSRALQEVSKYDASTAVTIGAHSSIGMRGLLLFGNKEQRERYYPKLATGEMIAAFCLTEPGSGSDAASIKTNAVKDGDHWVLNGEKLWITNGGIADFFTVFAKTGQAEERRQLSAFIVTKDMPGITIGPHEDKMGIRASSTTTVTFENVRVPAANLLGEEGKGFKVAMNILNSGRTGLGGGSVGGMKRLIALATKQANSRVQFGKKISEFGLVKKKVGEMVIDCYAAESVVSMVAGLVDSGHHDYQIEAAISKVFASEALWRTADEALQIAAGNGYMCEFPYEAAMRDSRINRIFEGTNDILRLFIALSAMDDVGQNLKEISDSVKGAFNDPIKGFGVLRDYAMRRATLATGIKREKFQFSKLPEVLKAEQEVFEHCTRDLAGAADRLLRKHGKRIIDKQFATARLADIMINLFVLGCVLSRVASAVEKHGPAAVERELQIAHALANRVRRQVQFSLHEIDDNADEEIKGLADHAFDLERFQWDTI